MNEITDQMRAAAIAHHESESLDSFAPTRYDELEFEGQSSDWLVLTNDEANERAKNEIVDSLWAFRTEFLANETGLPEVIFKALQDNERAEDNNEAIKALVEKGDNGLDDFVDAAIQADGRGHQLNRYDGTEIEVDAGTYTFEVEDLEADATTLPEGVTVGPMVTVVVEIPEKLYLYRTN